MAIDGLYPNLVLILRWLHILAGIIWIGHLYFFNFVNGPFQAGLPKEMKPTVNPALIGRALFFFRHAAMTTFVIGLILLFYKYSEGGLWFDAATGSMSHRAMWILFGGLLGTVMWFNVWFIIWPAQKQILGWVKNSQSPPEMAALVKRATTASRLNTYLSGPMLFGMVMPNNYGSINLVTLIFVLVVGFGTMHLLLKMAPKVQGL